MPDEPKFVAKTIKRVPAESGARSILPSLDSFKHMKQVAPNIPTINLSSINAVQLKDNLQRLMDDKSLTANAFIFTSRRYNKKLELERDRVEILLGIIDRVIETNKNIINYNVDVFLTQQRLEHIAFRHAVDMEREARAILREEELLARQHSDNLEKVDYEYNVRNQQLKSLEIANLKAQAEVNQMEARTQQDKIKADLMQKAIDNIDKLPPSLQTYIFRAVFNPSDKQEDDILLQDEIREYVKAERLAGANKATAEADQKKEETEQMKWRNQKEREFEK